MGLWTRLGGRAAAEVRGEGPVREGTRRLIEAARTHGASLQPMHPGAHDRESRSYFVADVEDEQADAALRTLRAHEAVEGAFVKPPDALP